MRRVILGIWRPCTVALAITFHPEFPISNFEFIISSNLRYVKKKVRAEDSKNKSRTNAVLFQFVPSGFSFWNFEFVDLKINNALALSFEYPL